jgi:processive 1,2-diacylglycerol beta-glucosyltransferase
VRGSDARPGRVVRSAQDAPLHVLVLSASMGAGHDGAAKELARRLEERGHTVSVRDYLPAIPLRLGFFIRWFYAMQLRLAPASYEWHYQHCERRGPVLRVSLWFANLARRRVRRLVRREDAAVVVSTYPLASQVLGTLRAQGRLATPTATFMTDFAPHFLWVHERVDLHLTVSPATAAETTRMTGRPAVPTGPLVPARFAERLAPADRTALRAELGLRDDDVVALVVAGSWGVGDVRTTVERVTAGGRVRCAVVCGRNEELRAELATIPGVAALGWRTDMPQLLQAADVLVENAGGLTAMEAFAVGLPVISHECLPGHGRDNAAAMEAAGVSTWVRAAVDLVPTVLAMTGELGRKQAGVAATVFAADPAVVVATLARTGDVSAAVRSAGLASGLGQAPVLARPSRRARARRRASLTATAAGTLLLTSTVGVSAATAMGVGVAQGNTDHPDAVYLVVRLATDDLGTGGDVSPRLIRALHDTAATVAVDTALVRDHPAALRALAAEGITLVNAGCGRGTSLDPRSAQRDLVQAKHSLDTLPGAQPWVFVTSRRLTALDLGTSVLGDDILVRPDTTVTYQRTPQLNGGKVVLVDGRGLDADRLPTVLTAAAADAAARHLTLRPLRDLLRSPH